jgi:hypothetical protein
MRNEGITIYKTGALYIPYVLNRTHKFGSFRTGNNTVSLTTTNRLMLLDKTVAVYCENHTEHINTLCGQNAEF